MPLTLHSINTGLSCHSVNQVLQGVNLTPNNITCIVSAVKWKVNTLHTMLLYYTIESS